MTEGVIEKKKNVFSRKQVCIEAVVVILVIVAGLFIRLLFLDMECVDARAFVDWLDYIRGKGFFESFLDFKGDYNVTFIPFMYLSGMLPFSTLTCVKVLALFFDLLGIIVGFLFLRDLALDEGRNRSEARHFGELGIALVWLSPITIGNGGCQAQLEGMWAFAGFLSLYMARKKHPVWAMVLFGFAFAMKPQGVFFLPFLILYYYRVQSFSILHFLIIPITIQVLCIPSMIAGNSFFYFWEHFLMQSNLAPYMYWYYPNIWIWMRDWPYWAFAKVGIGMMVTAFMLYTVAYAGKCRAMKWTFKMDLELALWTLMTCPIFLPAMHERYNYPTEVMLPVLAVFDRKYRVPAGIVVVSGVLCNGMSYYGWVHPEFYGCSVLNIIVYICLTFGVIGSLRAGTREGEKA